MPVEIQPVEVVEEEPEPEAEVVEYKLECKCGNVFLDDSNFCRMCGIPRAQAEALFKEKALAQAKPQPLQEKPK